MEYEFTFHNASWHKRYLAEECFKSSYSTYLSPLLLNLVLSIFWERVRVKGKAYDFRDNFLTSFSGGVTILGPSLLSEVYVIYCGH